MRAYNIVLAQSFGERFAATQKFNAERLVSYMPLASESFPSLRPTAAAAPIRHWPGLRNTFLTA